MERDKGEGLPPKQLAMVAGRLRAEERLIDVELPSGYVLRTYRPGDEEGWAEVLRLSGFGEWTTEKCREYVAEPTRLAGSHLVACGEQVVAVTFATPHKEDAEAGHLDYVAAHPEHQGMHLGRAVCTEVMRFFFGRGRERMELLTDDWRLPAIKLYLNLGFEPVLRRGDMPERWEVVFGELGWDEG